MTIKSSQIIHALATAMILNSMLTSQANAQPFKIEIYGKVHSADRNEPTATSVVAELHVETNGGAARSEFRVQSPSDEGGELKLTPLSVEITADSTNCMDNKPHGQCHALYFKFYRQMGLTTELLAQPKMTVGSGDVTAIEFTSPPSNRFELKARIIPRSHR